MELPRLVMLARFSYLRYAMCRRDAEWCYAPAFACTHIQVEKMRNSLRSVVFAGTLLAGMFAVPGTANACNQESYTGSVCSFAFDFCPRNWVAANGSLLSINSYQALYALLGTTYGGDGRTTFGVPDLRGRAMVGTGAGVYGNPGAAIPPVARGQLIGQPSVAAVVPLPQHTHAVTLGSMSAAGSVNVPLQGKVDNLPFTASPSLTVSGKAMIASTDSVGNPQRSNVPSSNAVLVTAQSGTASVYSASGSGIAANTVLGSDTAVSGTATGTVSGSASGGSLSGSAVGNVSLPITGTATVQPAGVNPAAMNIVTQSPSLGMTTCMMAYGIFPDRP